MFLVLSVLLYISVATAPADVDTMTVEVRDEVAVLTRTQGGFWHAHDPDRNEGFDVAVDGTDLIVAVDGESDRVDLSPHIVGLASIDWGTASELRTPVQGVAVLLERGGSRLTVTRLLDGERFVLGTVVFGADSVQQGAPEPAPATPMLPSVPAPNELGAGTAEVAR